jgi:hypothetical protein
MQTRFFSRFEEEMGLHLEISEIRLARKANGTVQHLSPGPHPMAGFEVTLEVEPEQWQTIQKNIRPAGEYYNTILEEPGEQGRIYVGGLYVSTIKEFRCGYAFTPNKIKLDRDRGMVDGFDLAWETSNLWTARGSNRAIDLLNDEAPDVRYVENHANTSSPLVLPYFRVRGQIKFDPQHLNDYLKKRFIRAAA